MERDTTIFKRYYDRWKFETQFLSTIQYKNSNYQALLNPNIISFKDICYGLMEVLRDKDDHIVTLLEDRAESEFGVKLFKVNGFVDLSTYCRTVKMTLAVILNEDLDMSIQSKKQEFFGDIL